MTIGAGFNAAKNMRLYGISKDAAMISIMEVYKLTLIEATAIVNMVYKQGVSK